MKLILKSRKPTRLMGLKVHHDGFKHINYLDKSHRHKAMQVKHYCSMCMSANHGKNVLHSITLFVWVTVIPKPLWSFTKKLMVMIFSTMCDKRWLFYFHTNFPPKLVGLFGVLIGEATIVFPLLYFLLKKLCGMCILGGGGGGYCPMRSTWDCITSQVFVHECIQREVMLYMLHNNHVIWRWKSWEPLIYLGLFWSQFDTRINMKDLTLE